MRKEGVCFQLGLEKRVDVLKLAVVVVARKGGVSTSCTCRLVMRLITQIFLFSRFPLAK